MVTMVRPSKTGEFEHFEHLSKMQALAHINNIEAEVKAPGALTIERCGQITGAVQRRTVLFLEQKRWHVIGGQINHQGSLTLGYQALRLQLFQGFLHIWLKERLTQGMLKGDTEEIVHLLEFSQRYLDKPVPVL